jgi:hypothetical protein
LSDERASGFFAKTPAAHNTHGDGQHVHDALRAAQALFKPKAKAASTEAQVPPADGVPPTEQPAPRKARILMASQPVPAQPEPETQAPLPIEEEGAAKKPQAKEIPASEYGRVRALAKYGMTVEQVAGTYEVSVDEVRRIISA